MKTASDKRKRDREHLSNH